MVLPLLMVLAASPKVLVVSEWGEAPREKWSGAVFAPLACTTPTAGLSASPDCLVGVPATGSVTMLDGTTEKAVAKKTAQLGLADCGATGERCSKRALWVRQKKASKVAGTSEREPAPLAVTLRREVGVWPADVAVFALVPGPAGVPLPKELTPLARPRAKNPTGHGPEVTVGDVLTFQLPAQAAPFEVFTIGDAFAYRQPGAASYVWGSSRRSPEPLALLAAVDLDGNGVPELVLGQQHDEGDSEFQVVELGPSPRVIAPAPLKP